MQINKVGRQGSHSRAMKSETNRNVDAFRRSRDPIPALTCPRQSDSRFLIGIAAACGERTRWARILHIIEHYRRTLGPNFAIYAYKYKSGIIAVRLAYCGHRGLPGHCYMCNYYTDTNLTKCRTGRLFVYEENLKARRLLIENVDCIR